MEGGDNSPLSPFFWEGNSMKYWTYTTEALALALWVGLFTILWVATP
jgi:hypothetical protein